MSPIVILNRRDFNVFTLPEGERATPGTVGFRGSEAGLFVVSPSNLPDGVSWDGFIYRVLDGVGDVVIENCIFDHTLWVYSQDFTTIRNCIIEGQNNEIYGFQADTSFLGTILMEDTTIRCHPDNEPTFAQLVQYGIFTDCMATIRRCDVSGSGDGIHFVGTTGTLITQCVVHDLRYIDEEQHLDGMQHYQDTVDASYTIEHSYVEYTESTIGTPMNASVTSGPATATGPLHTPTIDNCFFGGGVYHLRVNHQARNIVVTNNDFGPLKTGVGEIAYFDGGDEDLTVAEWSNNRDSEGELIPFP